MTFGELKKAIIELEEAGAPDNAPLLIDRFAEESEIVWTGGIEAQRATSDDEAHWDVDPEGEKVVIIW